MGKPAYAYGWIVPKNELHEVIYGEPCDPWTGVLEVSEDVEQTFKDEWMAKGYCNGSAFQHTYKTKLQQTEPHSPKVPAAFGIGKDHILIYMIGNDSDEEMTRIMEDKEYHERCKDCMKRTSSMGLPPAWFRSNLKRVPKGLLEVLQQHPQPVQQAPQAASIVSCAPFH